MPRRSSRERMQLRAKAMAALKVQASPESWSRIDHSFDELCVELVSEWIVGEPRLESQTQQTEYWISRFYEDLVTDEQPEPSRLYARFTLSLPRAQYVTRLLRARMASTWRATARDELRRCLEGAEAKARATDEKALSTQTFDLSLSRGAFDELIVLYDFAAVLDAAGRRPAPPRRLPSSPRFVSFSVTAETVLILLTTVRNGGAP